MDSLINLALIAGLIFGVGSIAALVFFVSINRQPDIEKRIVDKNATKQAERARKTKSNDVPANNTNEHTGEQKS